MTAATAHVSIKESGFSLRVVGPCTIQGVFPLFPSMVHAVQGPTGMLSIQNIFCLFALLLPSPSTRPLSSFSINPSRARKRCKCMDLMDHRAEVAWTIRGPSQQRKSQAHPVPSTIPQGGGRVSILRNGFSLGPIPVLDPSSVEASTAFVRVCGLDGPRSGRAAPACRGRGIRRTPARGVAVD